MTLEQRMEWMERWRDAVQDLLSAAARANGETAAQLGAFAISSAAEQAAIRAEVAAQEARLRASLDDLAANVNKLAMTVDSFIQAMFHKNPNGKGERPEDIA